MKKLITHDLYNISSRAQNIDRDYLIFYDYARKIYEVHHHGKIVKLLGNKLDKSCLDSLYTSHVRNSRKIFEDMDETNSRIDRKNESELLRRSREELSSKVAYADKRGYDVDFSRANATRWI